MSTSDEASKHANYPLTTFAHLQVCAAVGVEVLSGGRVKILGGANSVANLRVGRLDSLTPREPNRMPDVDDDLEDWQEFWQRSRFSPEEAVALMGAHGLMEKQACMMSLSDSDFCDPLTTNCTTTRMHRWEPHYFAEACAPTVRVVRKPAMEYPDSPEYLMDQPAFEAHKKHELCKFTSPLFRTRSIIPLAQRRAKLLPPLPQPEDVEDEVVSWSNDGCERGKAWGSPACPHSLNWMYSIMDGRLGQACQRAEQRRPSPIQAAMRKFISPQAWVSG